VKEQRDSVGVADVEGDDAGQAASEVADHPMRRSGGGGVPIIVGTALLMSSLNASSISVGLPSMAVDLGVLPLRLNVVLTAYVLAQVAFLPTSAWLADRFGAKTMLQVAIALFAVASLACGLAQSLVALVLARVMQGCAGAMISPVGRLILLRSTPRHELVGALSVLSIPVQLGPLAGPLVGGLVVGALGWHWIFLINLPVAALAFILVWRFAPDVPPQPAGRLDRLGSILIGAGSVAFVYALDSLLNVGVDPWPSAIGMVLTAGFLSLYWRHARARDDAALDLALFRIRTFRIAVIGGAFFRLIPGATPFMLAMLFQVALGMSALTAGTMTFMTAVGSIVMKAAAQPILRRFGFRRVLLINGAITAAIFMCYGMLGSDTPAGLIMLALAVGGFFRALQFSTTWGLAFADVEERDMARATTTTAMVQQLMQSVSTALVAIILFGVMELGGRGELDSWTVGLGFPIIGALSLLSLLWFARLSPDAGHQLIRSR